RDALALGVAILGHAADDEVRWRRGLTRIRVTRAGLDNRAVLLCTVLHVLVALHLRVVIDERTGRTVRVAADGARWWGTAARIGPATRGRRRRATLVLTFSCGQVLAFDLSLVLTLVALLTEAATDRTVRLAVVHVALEVVVTRLVSDRDVCTLGVESQER